MKEGRSYAVVMIERLRYFEERVSKHIDQNSVCDSEAEFKARYMIATKRLIKKPELSVDDGRKARMMTCLAIIMLWHDLSDDLVCVTMNLFKFQIWCRCGQGVEQIYSTP